MRCKTASGRIGRWGYGLIACAAIAGCASTPPPAAPPPPPPVPSTVVYFYPTQGQPPMQQDRDKYECNEWAVKQSGFDPSAPNVPPHLRVVTSAGPPPGAGVATGAVAGAAIGAAVSRPWEAGQGALAGAVAGAIIGGIAESAAAEHAREQAAANASYARAAALERQASNYRRAISACLEGRGYSVR